MPTKHKYPILNYLKIFIKKKLNKDYESNPIIFDKKIISQVSYYNNIIDKIKNLDGNFIECGVGKGRSLFIISSILENLCPSKKIYACDTFTGFPSLSNEDLLPNKKIWKGYYAVDLDYVKKYLTKSNFKNLEKIKFIKGDIKETLKNFDDKLSLIHLDVDIYSSYEFSLNKLYENLVPKGIIMIDEYESVKWSNLKGLIQNFCEKNNLTLVKSDFKEFDRVYLVKN